jgi:hypothetical protein
MAATRVRRKGAHRHAAGHRVEEDHKRVRVVLVAQVEGVQRLRMGHWNFMNIINNILFSGTKFVLRQKNVFLCYEKLFLRQKKTY